MIYGRDLGTVKTFYIDTHTQKNTKPVIQDPNCFVCVMHNKRQAFKNKLIVFLYSTDHKMESRAVTVIQPWWACQLLLLLFFCIKLS